jgi:hypothetical protein
MLAYHGTDKESADQILSSKILKGDLPLFGPGICTTIQRALNFSAIKSIKHGVKARKFGRILIFNIDEKLLTWTTSENCTDAFTINKHDGNPLPFIHVPDVVALTIPQAQQLLRK